MKPISAMSWPMIGISQGYPVHGDEICPSLRRVLSKDLDALPFGSVSIRMRCGWFDVIWLKRHIDPSPLTHLRISFKVSSCHDIVHTHHSYSIVCIFYDVIIYPNLHHPMSSLITVSAILEREYIRVIYLERTAILHSIINTSRIPQIFHQWCIPILLYQYQLE